MRIGKRNDIPLAYEKVQDDDEELESPKFEIGLRRLKYQAGKRSAIFEVNEKWV